MIFWVNACRSFTLENIQWKNMSFCWGSVRIDRVLTSPGTDPCHTQAPTTWHWTWRKPPSEPACRLDAKPWNLIHTELSSALKRKAPSPCNSSIFISQITQSGRVGGRFFSFFKRSKCLALVQCASSAHGDMAQNWHPVQVWWTWCSGLSHLIPNTDTCTASLPNTGSNLCWGQVPKATFF